MALSVNGGPLSFEADIQMGQFMQKLDEIERGINGITQASEKEMKSIEGLVQKATGALAAYTSFSAASSFISDVVRVRSEFEALSTSFNVMLGSKEKADKLMGEVVDFAAKTPFSLQELSGATKSLLAFGVQAKDIRGTLQALGDVSAGIGAPIKEIADIYGKAKVQGRLFAEDINQLTGRGIPIIQELAKQFGVTEDKVRGLVESGKVGFPQIEQAFKDMTSSGSQFGGMMEAMAGTLGGAISNMQDSWSRLLNTIGQSNEGILKGSVEGLTMLIEHYEDVLDILKVLIATYGAYRAALIANAVTVKVYDIATRRLSIAQTLQATASAIATRATQALNTAMKANPALLFAGAVGALVAALIIFNRRADESSRKAQVFAAAQEKVAEGMAEVQGKIQPYVEALKNANLSEQQRVDIYNKLKEINPKIVDGLTAQTISYDKLKKNVDLYLESLRRKITMEANEEAVTASIKEEGKLNDKLSQLRASYQALVDQEKAAKKSDNISAQTLIEIARSKKTIGKQIDETKKLIDEQKDLQKSLGEAIVGPTTTTMGKKTLDEFLADSGNLLANYKEYIKLVANKDDAEKVQKALIAKMESFAPGDKAKEAYKKKILEVKALIKQYSIEDPSKAASAQSAVDKKENALLEARKDLLQSIADIRAQAEADTKGKQLSELEKINQKYDGLIRKVSEFNERVNEWNKDPKNKKNQVPLVGGEVTRQIDQARALEISQELMEEDVKRYEKSLSEKRDLYRQYQKDVQDLGRQDADKLYDKDKLAFDSYLDYLKSEIGKLGTKISLGVNLNLADQGKLKQLTEELKTVTKEQADEQIAQTKRVFIATLNAAEQRKIIEANYQKEVAILEKTYQGQELEERKRVLKQSLDEDLAALAQHLGQQDSLYRKLNKDIYTLATKRIDDEITALENQMEAIKDSDPGLAASIQKAIDKWKELKKEMTGTLDTLDQVGAIAGELGPAFSDLGNAVSPLNEALGESLSLIGSVLNNVKQATDAYKKFQKAQKDYKAAEKGQGLEGILGMVSAGLGIVGAVVGVVSAIAGVFKKRKEERRQEAIEEQQRLMNIYKGEVEINMLYRERAREQVLINKLKLEGLEAEKRLLEEQALKNAELVQDVFKQLALITDPRALVFGNGDPFPYASKTFEELQKLDAQGLLKDKAKELFDILNKLHEEGVNIEKLRQENEQRQKETFTATTADSIADSIIQGFKAGKRGIKDFADSFQELMQGALLNALKYQTLEKPLKDFYEQFAANAQSDGALTQSEIADLQRIYNDLIANAGKQFEELQKVTGVSFNGTGADKNSLQGAIKGMSQETAELLAGQFAGQRLATLELLKVAQTNLNIQTRIQGNTANTVSRLEDMITTMTYYFENRGIKLR